MCTATITVPDNLLFALREDENQLADSMKKEYAVRMFQDGRLTLVQAGEFCGLDIYDFTELLASRNIPVIDYSVEDLEKEIASLRAE
jgi:predicted HTH domain antitoxin